MTLYPSAVEKLAEEFDPYFARLWHWQHGRIWPRDIAWAEAEKALTMLTERVGPDNFRRVAEKWESWIVPGIDD